ncbi:hypothetical protein V5O48_019000 [Marasmius crinis-equi]|uniref:Uncharacterized protein n=1 Tax=Marasmius crinis-equi TaxID=585013 RepID=A0ABR3EJR1_9AGAR
MGHSGDWRHPSPGPSLGAATNSSSGAGAGAGMSPTRLAKEREAFGGGGFAGGVGMPVPQHQQRPNQPAGPGSQYSGESGGAQGGGFHSTSSEYSQGNSSAHPTSSQQHGPRLSLANPDSADAHGGQFSEDARRAYLAGGPVSSRVRVAQDAGALGDEEIPPTYDSLVAARAARGEAAPVAPPEKGGLRVTNDGDDGPGGSGSGAAPRGD